jgi:SSS family solute:Na+ symporter
MESIHLAHIDYAILLIYVAFVIGIGWVLSRYMKSSADFLTSARSIPTWVTGLAFISANLGALELVGMAASGAKYGIATAHFYWVGAIPAMIFLAVFMMPFYYGSKARSVPEYLQMRFDNRVMGLNAIAFAVMTLFASGISMNALAKLLHSLLGWDYNVALFVCSGVVLLYVLKGGLTSAIYTEVLQFFMIVLGFAPVVWLAYQDTGGWSVIKDKLAGVAAHPAMLNLKDSAATTYSPDAWSSAWKPLLGGSDANPMGVDVFAIVFGLGFVLSFGYWCTNFLVVQRAMAAKNMTAARNTPLVAAVPKMFFPILVILPGILAVSLASLPGKNYHLPQQQIEAAKYTDTIAALTQAAAKNEKPADAAADLKKAAGVGFNPAKVEALLKDAPLPEDTVKARLQDAVELDYDNVILSLVKRYCPAGLLGLALTALLASFMSGMAGNVTAFNTVWTYNLYQAFLVRGKSDNHYFWMGKFITVVGIVLSIGCAYFAKQYNNAMDVIQLVFGFVNAPLFATFLLGMFWKRTTATGAFYGLFGGIGGSAIFHALTTTKSNVDAMGHAINVMKGGYLGTHVQFPSEMAQNFWLAAFAFTCCFVLTLVISLATRRTKSDVELKGLVYSLTPKIVDTNIPVWQRPAVVGVVLLVVCVILNYIFW